MRGPSHRHCCPPSRGPKNLGVALVVLGWIWLGGCSGGGGCGGGSGGGSGGAAGLSGGGAAGSAAGGSAGASGAAGAGTGGLSGAAGTSTGGAAGNVNDSGMGGSAGTTGSGGAAGAPPDAAPDAPVSQFCGDGIRDPLTEECDDGTGITPPDSCNAQCQVQDVLVSPSAGSDGGVAPKVARRLGDGRHPVGAGDSGFTVGFVTILPLPIAIGLEPFDANGVPATGAIAVASDSSITENANPVVAALPNGKYAVAYADLNADGSGLGVAMRIVDGASGQVGSLVRVNTTKTFGQHDPDLIWTGSELVAAWVDDSSLPTTGTDIKLRHFGSNGVATSTEQTLGGSSDFESDVALAPFSGGWAAAWRVASGSGEHVIATAGATSWAIALTAPGPSDDKPALAELDATHLLLVFSEGGGNTSTPRLRGAVLDMAVPGSASAFAIDPSVAPYSSDPSLGQSHPNVVRAGTRVYVAWRSELVPGVAEAEELWLKEVTWTASSAGGTLDLSAPEIPLPRWPEHRLDDQRRPALAATPLGPQGALATAWDDYGRVFGSIEGTPDVVAELIPVPIVRLGGAVGQ